MVGTRSTNNARSTTRTKSKPRPKIQYEGSKRKISIAPGKAGRGAKETFKRRRDTIYRKIKELSVNCNVEAICIIYQKSRNLMHFADTGTVGRWPFDVQKFVDETYPTPKQTFVQESDGEGGTELQAAEESASDNGSDDEDTIVCAETPDRSKRSRSHQEQLPSAKTSPSRPIPSATNWHHFFLALPLQYSHDNKRRSLQLVTMDRRVPAVPASLVGA